MFLQVSAAVPATVPELVLNATPFSKVVLVVLAVLSLASWAVMISTLTVMSGRKKSGLLSTRSFRSTVPRCASTAGAM